MSLEECRTAHSLIYRAVKAFGTGSIRTIKFAAAGFTFSDPNGYDIRAFVDQTCIRFLVSEAYSFGTDVEPSKMYGNSVTITVNWATYRRKDAGTIFSADVTIPFGGTTRPHTLRVYYPNLPFQEFHNFLTARWEHQ
ncbi:hypothetical protein SCHPADRAFT_945310 [Schizopora paradoxa]|uniref:Uncharacterized protein n=1 Tax=Schizopora paradoxa TaxID=27342 RepID=A0A0H2RD32_9AGAM|nr:hypothetical protein SCHPADRAFT_945310 [Schizopora paradoxa]